MFSLLSHSLSIAKAKPAAKSSAEQLFRNCRFTASYIKAWPALTSSKEKIQRMARALSSADCVIGRALFVSDRRAQRVRATVPRASDQLTSSSRYVRVWKKRLELQAHSRFRIRSACG